MKTIFAAVSLLLLSVAAYSAQPEEIVIAHPEQRNAQRDCRAALRRGDFRLVAVYGFTLEIPGVDVSEWIAYQRRYGVKVIAGTGDDGSAIQPEAESYATQYNRTLLEHFKSKPRRNI